MSLDQLAQSAPPNSGEPRETLRRIRCVTVIDHEGAALHERIGDEPPVPAVARVVAIVSEHEIILLWDDQRTPIVSCRIVLNACARSARAARCDDEIALPAEALFDAVDVGVVGDVPLR